MLINYFHQYQSVQNNKHEIPFKILAIVSHWTNPYTNEIFSNLVCYLLYTVRIFFFNYPEQNLLIELFFSLFSQSSHQQFLCPVVSSFLFLRLALLLAGNLEIFLKFNFYLKSNQFL